MSLINFFPFIQEARAQEVQSGEDVLVSPINIFTAGLKTGTVIGSSFALSSAARVLGKTAKGKLAWGLVGGGIPSLISEWSRSSEYLFENSPAGQNARIELGLAFLDTGLGIGVGILTKRFLPGLVASMLISGGVEYLRQSVVYHQQWSQAFCGGISAIGWNTACAMVLYTLGKRIGARGVLDSHKKRVLNDQELDKLLEKNIREARQSVPALINQAEGTVASSLKIAGVEPTESVTQWVAARLRKGELGRRLIERGGLSGEDTARYMNPGPIPRWFDSHNPATWENLDPFLLHLAPSALATQKRNKIFGRVFQDLFDRGIISRGDRVVTLPSGTGHDVLDWGRPRDIRWVGIDNDPEALRNFERSAQRASADRSQMLRADAKTFLDTHPSLRGNVRGVVSNGWTIYVNDDDVLRFFKQVYSVLPQRGVFIVSNLTPPPSWVRENINPFHAAIQTLIFKGCVNAQFSHFRTPEQMIGLLKQAGFQGNIEVHLDLAGIFPTYVVSH